MDLSGTWVMEGGGGSGLGQIGIRVGLVCSGVD